MFITIINLTLSKVIILRTIALIHRVVPRPVVLTFYMLKYSCF